MRQLGVHCLYREIHERGFAPFTYFRGFRVPMFLCPLTRHLALPHFDYRFDKLSVRSVL